MIKYFDECIGCTSMGLPCMGSSCNSKNVERYYCDRCGDEFEPDELYDDDGDMVCADCILSQYKKISI